jgi:membrane fusion protein (multidrug efflux system)
VRVNTGVLQDTLVVPERAVSQLQGQNQVGVVASDGRVQIRNVKLGRLFDHAYLVESGLSVGEHVIIEGLQNVQPGAKVKVQEQPPSPQASTATPPKSGGTAAAEAGPGE